MAENRKPNLFERIRGNAEWDAIKWFWEVVRAAFLPAVYWTLQRLRHVHVDWIGLGILFFLTLLVALQIGEHPKRETVRNRLVSIEPKARTPLNPLQTEALQLARDLRQFLVELGPRPNVEIDQHGSGEGYIGEVLKVRDPWYNRLWDGYVLRHFPDSVSVLYMKLGEQGFTDPEARQYASNPRQPEHIAALARSLTEMVARIEDANLPTKL